jgi:6-pyruvoyltetrahydropterin/6-carboxytetrahydropterin synthase
MEIFKAFQIEAAHRLPKVPAGHKCGRLHGHSYRIEIHMKGELGAESGWVADFGDLKHAFEDVFQTLDHSYLNEVPGLENPTSENLARWIWQRLFSRLAGLSAIVVAEACTTGCVFRGDHEL